MSQNLLVILGPTAVGKTDLSIDIASYYNGEVISGDSMQVYKGMDIGTAKITKEEMRNIPHHLIDSFDPSHYFTVAEFQETASEHISAINQLGKLPIIVGGTGLYIKSVTHQYQFPSATTDDHYRLELQEWVEKHGNQALHDKLNKVDPVTASKLHPNDVKRIIRALEIYHTTGSTMSILLKEQTQESPYNLLMIGLYMDRSKLYDRINRRVDLMVEKGLVDEVKQLLAKGYDEKYHAMQGIGYKEILQYLKGEISLDKAIDAIKQNSRRFAKRQLSWFRNMSNIHWFDVTTDNQDEINKKIYDTIAGKYPSMKNK